MARNPDDEIDDGDAKRGRMEELEMRVEELEGALKVAEARIERISTEWSYHHVMHEEPPYIILGYDHAVAIASALSK